MGCVVVWAGGVVPFAIAFWANRHTSLRDAVVWMTLAWATWGFALTSDPSETRLLIPLGATAAAGVAVLGARRPLTTAWNFVVLGLLGVLWLPLAERLVLDVAGLDGPRWTFLVGTLALATLNYLPTRFAVAALVAGGTLASWLVEAARPGALGESGQTAARWATVAVPWLAWLWPTRASTSEADGLWQEFRDRFGVVWGQRLREQFRHAAAHAGVSATLGWLRLRAETPDAEQASARLLRSLAQRFLPADPQSGMPAESSEV